MATIPLQEPVYRGDQDSIFFAAGFRPFFLSAGILAALFLPLWLVVYAGRMAIFPDPVLWHAHEMVFGFAGAAVGGFLLTAVPNWTGTHHASGKPLMLLFAAWIAGRLGWLAAGYLPAWLVAGMDLAYLPLLAWSLANPLIKAGKWRNIVFLPILALFWLSNLVTHLGGLLPVMPLQGAYMGMALVLLMITIVGGRIVPSFTQNWLRMQGRVVEVVPASWVEKGGAQGSALVACLCMALAPQSVISGVILLAAAAIHAYRLSGWHGAKTFSHPILWVLHVGYGWMVAGFALAGLSALIPALPLSAAIHALTAGAMGTMVLGVMTRAALGHSGRMLVVSTPIIVAYWLVSLGTLLRIVAPLAGGAQMGLIHAAGSLWGMAWILFVIVYWPVCTKPRADGRPG